MFGDVVTYELELNTWRDPEGELWTPNTTLLLQAPGAMIYEPYEFLIKSVILTRQAKAEKAKLELVMPGAFSGEQPEALPWG
jgi:prophage tail gpP-like protein